MNLRRLRLGLSTGLLLTLSAGAAAAQAPEGELRCAYTKRMVCSTEGCMDSEIGSNHLRVEPLPALRKSVETAAPIAVRRCDAGGCSRVEITQAAGSGFLTLSAENGAYLIKIYDGPEVRDIDLNPGDFTEIVTSMFTTWVGYGRCTAARP